MMKRLLAILLACILALGSVAMAATYSDKETVKAVQEALNAAGYNCGTPDGIAGNNTKNAILSYQASKGMKQTGVIDDELLIAMGLMEAPEPSPEPEPEPGRELDEETAIPFYVGENLQNRGFSIYSEEGLRVSGGEPRLDEYAFGFSAYVYHDAQEEVELKVVPDSLAVNGITIQGMSEWDVEFRKWSSSDMTDGQKMDNLEFVAYTGDYGVKPEDVRWIEFSYEIIRTVEGQEPVVIPEKLQFMVLEPDLDFDEHESQAVTEAHVTLNQVYEGEDRPLIVDQNGLRVWVERMQYTWKESDSGYLTLDLAFENSIGADWNIGVSWSSYSASGVTYSACYLNGDESVTYTPSFHFFRDEEDSPYKAYTLFSHEVIGARYQIYGKADEMPKDLSSLTFDLSMENRLDWTLSFKPETLTIIVDGVAEPQDQPSEGKEESTGGTEYEGDTSEDRYGFIVPGEEPELGKLGDIRLLVTTYYYNGGSEYEVDGESHYMPSYYSVFLQVEGAPEEPVAFSVKDVLVNGESASGWLYFTDEEMNGFDEVLNPDETQCVINIENGNQDLPPADAIESITFRLVMTDEAGETVLAETETLSAPLNW